MKILALDTAMAACSAAVIDTAARAPLAAEFVPMERGHAEAIAPMVERVMEQSGLTFKQMDRIAVTTGPGTFTGVRIGLAMARGLGLALGIPVVGIDSLSAIAANANEDSHPVLVACDARNTELYCAVYDGARKERVAPRIMTIDDAVRALIPGMLVIGSAADAVIAASGRTDVTRSQAGDLPDARNFARRAETKPADGMPSPLYLRAPDAKPQIARLRPASALCVETVGPASSALLAEIHADSFDAPWAADEFEALLASPGTQALVGLEHGEPLGFILIRTAADEAEIITLATRPQARRRGVAQRLVEDSIGGSRIGASPRCSSKWARQTRRRAISMAAAASSKPAGARAIMRGQAERRRMPSSCGG